jgi:hypothetical protein
MKNVLFLLAMVACGGQTIGDIDGGTDAKTDSITPNACTKNSDCGKGLCGFAESAACAAKGQCFPEPGAVCNGFSPGCACDGTTINVMCTGLPDGYATAPLAHVGACTTSIDAGSTYSCVDQTCVPGKDICVISANPQTGSCLPANGCTDCQCAQSMFQCVSSCKQNGPEIFIQCQ